MHIAGRTGEGVVGWIDNVNIPGFRDTRLEDGREYEGINRQQDQRLQDQPGETGDIFKIILAYLPNDQVLKKRIVGNYVHSFSHLRPAYRLEQTNYSTVFSVK